MKIISKFKSLLSKIIVAQYTKKKNLKIKKKFLDSLFLDLLWKNGFIFGYSRIKNGYIVFLKYSLRGLSLLNSLVVLDNTINNKQFNKMLITLVPYDSYIVLTRCRNL
jgi:ribosomal protein S8